MILLTDEEILRVLDRIPQVKAGDSLIPMVEASAKAQLKKDTKRFYGYTRYSKPIFGYVGDMGECATVIAHIPVGEYEALPEEVK